MKDKWWSEKAAAVQEVADRKDSKQLYNLLGEIYEPNKSNISPLLAKDSETLLKEPTKIRER